MSPLPNRSLVEDRCYSLDKSVVKCSRLYDHALLFRFPSLVSSLSINLFFPPIGVALDWKCRDGIEFHRIGKSRSRVAQTLPESENIGPMLAVAKRFDDRFI